jgi:predicted Ser/Thr protein kinase
VSDDEDLREAARQLLAGQAPCAPDTLKMMAQFAVLSRLKEPENSSIFSKMRSTTARTSRTPIPRPRATRSTATTPASTRA